MRLILVAALFGWASVADAAERWCRYERDAVCGATACGPGEEASLSLSDFKLTSGEQPNIVVRTSCQGEECIYDVQRFSINPTIRTILYGDKGWVLTFPADDNRFVEFVSIYTEEKGARIPAAQVRTGYCANYHIPPRR